MTSPSSEASVVPGAGRAAAGIEGLEPFATALRLGALSGAVDADAQEPTALYWRGIVRSRMGREQDARRDFELASQSLGDACRIEIALLDLHELNAGDARDIAVDVAGAAPPASHLRARAFHVLGLAYGRLRNTAAAFDALLKSAECYRSAGEAGRCAEVYDSLGMIAEARGRLDHALGFYAIALTDKCMGGDRYGTAITLGNMGRVHLREGRFRDALDCFERDAGLSEALGDQRGIARTAQDIGRAWLATGELKQAEEALLRSVRAAEAGKQLDLVFFARKELATLRLRQGKYAEGQHEIDAAERCLPPGAELTARLIVRGLRGELAALRGDPEAFDLLDTSIDGFTSAELPDMEIPARVSFGRLLMKEGMKASAEKCLMEGMRRARSDGYARYLPLLKEAMAELDLVEGAVVESYRPLHSGARPPGGAYIERERIGAGSFGEVFRAFDPQRDREVALKRLHLGMLYDVANRRRLIASAQRELEAASRVRHPGVVRVLAIGEEPGGDMYVVQEFIDGRALRDVMAGQPRWPLGRVLQCLGRVADALAALHAAGVIHRDIKPENIIIRADDSPVLVDFGIAHAVGRMRESAERGADGFLGTLEYLAPEQARNRKLDGRSDLYALGIVAYEWLAGCRPLRLRGDGLDAMLKDLCARRPPALTDFRPDLAGEVNSLVMKLIEKRPGRRPKSAQEAAELFRAAAAGKSVG